eukprot:CAMPEP_0183355624 /NCGR_PEP_ID=MMETSP0164_2-20130417/41180_1 /TAXON_ID=221442 /ORGANISM="Coccolithus pelagicus ssp braarudi, Strain PLY182g" /LENGTH=41 /DNA_ID= /DNA_START= /DNA_END= /DNA_ORIENTATION=
MAARDIRLLREACDVGGTQTPQCPENPNIVNDLEGGNVLRG